jgi:transcriptional regulator with XRE-family HTH domain
MAALGDRIRALAEAKGLSLRALGRIAGVDSKTLSRYASGRIPPADVVARLCLETGASFRWLLTGDGAMFEPRPFEDRLADLASAKVYTRQAVARELLDGADLVDRERGTSLSGVLVGLYDASEHLPDPFVAGSIRRLLHIAAVNDRDAMAAVVAVLKQHDPGPEKAGLLARLRKPNVGKGLKP